MVAKERYDPLNIAKKLTACFIGDVLIFRMTLRSKEDIQYFAWAKALHCIRT
jgi:hypothetical protein